MVNALFVYKAIETFFLKFGGLLLNEALTRRSYIWIQLGHTLLPGREGALLISYVFKHHLDFLFLENRLHLLNWLVMGKRTLCKRNVSRGIFFHWLVFSEGILVFVYPIEHTLITLVPHPVWTIVVLRARTNLRGSGHFSINLFQESSCLLGLDHRLVYLFCNVWLSEHTCVFKDFREMQFANFFGNDRQT